VRSKLIAALASVALLGIVACTSDEPAAPPSPSATASPTVAVTATPAAVATPRGPCQVGEPIHLDVVPYDGATLTEVTAEAVLPDRDTLDREGGSFVWDRESDGLQFIEGVQYLFLASGLVDGRPIGIAFTPIDGPEPLRSVVVRFDPFEVVALPLALNVGGGALDAPWAGPSSVTISFWQATEWGDRILPAGDYAFDLETATLRLMRGTLRGISSVRVVEEVWPSGTSERVAMVLQNGRRSLNHGVGGAGEEIAGPVEPWTLSPDGSRLLMVGNRSQLVVYDLRLDRRWVLGRPAEYGAAEWSPDGRYIAATVFDTFEDTTQALVFDAGNLDAVAFPDFGVSAVAGLALPPLEDAWTWRWRNATELFTGTGSTLLLLDVETGELRTVLDDREPYDTLASDETTSTLALSRLRGTPASILELDEAAGWFDIPLLAASPQVGLFDMNWGGVGQWLALNTTPGRS